MATNVRHADPWITALKNGQVFVRIASLLTFTSGILLAWQPILRHTRPIPGRFERFILPENLRSVADFTSLAIGLILIYLAYELMQRKRSAWFITLVASTISIATEVYFRQPISQSLFVMLVLIVLIIGREQFIVRVRTASWVQSLQALAGSILIALAYGTVGFWLLDKRDFGVTFSFTQAFIHTLQQYSLIDTGDLVTHTRYSKWFLDSLSIVGITTVLYCLYNLARPLEYELKKLPHERAKARSLLEVYGGDIDDYFKLWPEDKTFFFSSDGEACIAYAVARGVAMAFANPEGRPDSIRLVLEEFKDFCLENGWLIAFIAAGDKYQKVFSDLGFNNIIIGADAVITTEKFVTETARNKYFRNVNNRFEKTGVTAERYLPPHTPELIQELRAVSNDWLRIPGHKQWRFLTGYFSSRYFKETPLFVVRDEKGKALAFANEIPSYRQGYATIDLMRHRQNIPKNTMDFLFMSLIRKLHEEGYTYFNLGLSPLARQTLTNGSKGLLDYIYLASQRFVSAKGLHQYKSKFDPDWEARYVYYIGTSATLPQISLSLAKLTIYK